MLSSSDDDKVLLFRRKVFLWEFGEGMVMVKVREFYWRKAVAGGSLSSCLGDDKNGGVFVGMEC